MDNIYEKYRNIFWEVFSKYDFDADDLGELEDAYTAMCKTVENYKNPACAVRYQLHRKANTLIEAKKFTKAGIIPMPCRDEDTEYAGLVKCCSSALQEMLNDLSPKQGLVIAMHYGLGDYRQMTINEIADTLHISRYMVEKYQRCAMLRLRNSANLRKLEGLLSIFAEQPMYMLEVR